MTEHATPADELGTVVDVLNALEELLGASRSLPFTSSVVVNEEEIIELADRIRLSLPDEVVRARHTLDERDQLLDRAARDADELLARAGEEAERLVREAHARAADLVDEHAVLRAATEKANEVGAAADEHAASQRRAADDYAREVMQRLEEQLERWLATVREGISALPEQPQSGRRRKR